MAEEANSSFQDMSDRQLIDAITIDKKKHNADSIATMHALLKERGYSESAIQRFDRSEELETKQATDTSKRRLHEDKNDNPDQWDCADFGSFEQENKNWKRIVIGKAFNYEIICPNCQSSEKDMVKTKVKRQWVCPDCYDLYKNMFKKELEEVKDLFNFLAKEEVKHEKIFTDMLSNIDEYQIKESYEDEYKSYLNAYANNLLFSLKNFDEAMEKVKDLDSAFQFAIQKELDTIMYYQELKNIVQENKTDLIEDIINEERKHVVLLTQKKEKLV